MFEVGEQVTVRQWNDMVKEFGANSFGGVWRIQTPLYTFTESMQKLCGSVFTIRTSEIIENKNGKNPIYAIQLNNCSWFFSSPMFEESKINMNFSATEWLSLMG